MSHSGKVTGMHAHENGTHTVVTVSHKRGGDSSHVMVPNADAKKLAIGQSASVGISPGAVAESDSAPKAPTIVNTYAKKQRG